MLGREIARPDLAMRTYLEQRVAREAAEAAARRTASQVERQVAEGQREWATATRLRPTAAFGNVRDPGVVYLRVNPKATTYAERYYVGQSKSASTYFRRQAAHNRNLGREHQYQVIATAQKGDALNFAEEAAIRSGGGRRILANMRHQMNDKSYMGMGGTLSKQTH